MGNYQDVITKSHDYTLQITFYLLSRSSIISLHKLNSCATINLAVGDFFDLKLYLLTCDHREIIVQVKVRIMRHFLGLYLPGSFEESLKENENFYSVELTQAKGENK